MIASPIIRPPAPEVPTSAVLRLFAMATRSVVKARLAPRRRRASAAGQSSAPGRRLRRSRAEASHRPASADTRASLRPRVRTASSSGHASPLPGAVSCHLIGREPLRTARLGNYGLILPNFRGGDETFPQRSLRHQDAPTQTTRPAGLQALSAKPSDGLEPSTPSLPWRFWGGTRVHARSLATRFSCKSGSNELSEMRRETSRVSFLMCPFCVRALMPNEATCVRAPQQHPSGRSPEHREGRPRRVRASRRGEPGEGPGLDEDC